MTTGVQENITEETEINEAIQAELRKTDTSSTVTGEGDEKEITYKNKLYIVNVKTGNAKQMTQEELAKRAIKIKVNTGEDGIVVLPIDEDANCTIDWGDGTTTATKNKEKEENIKVASINNSIKLGIRQTMRNTT